MAEQLADSEAPQVRNIRVLGTSNSILRGGWIDGLRETTSLDVNNLSAGASASAFALWQLADSGFPTADDTSIYMLDTLVNDETFIAAKRYDFSWWHYYQRAILSILQPERTLFVGFASRKFFAPPSLQAMMQEAMCAEFGARFISLRRILLSSMRHAVKVRPEIDGDSIFEDPGHFHRHLSHLFGRWLGENLLVSTAPAPSPKPIQDSGFEALAPTDHDGVEEERRTSLRRQDTIVLKVGGRFTLPGDRILHGVCVDASNTRCYLNIDVGDAQNVSVELAYNTKSDRMQVKFVHFKVPIVLPKGGATVTVADSPAHKVVLGIHSRPKDGAFHGVRLLSFLSGPVVDQPGTPVFTPLEQPNAMTQDEKRSLRRSGMVDTLINPPDVPKYPRSFIEL